MEFINHTPFPALAFAGVDQRGQEFHVVVLRQTLTWNDAGEMLFSEAQQPLCEADEFFGADMQGSVRQESDLCPFKPRCDVIVNATAYLPRRPDGRAPGRFDIRLMVSRPGAPAPLPPEPQGLNPLMPASPEEMQAWRTEVEHAKHTVIPGQRLIDKTLTVTGERHFIKRAGLLRLVAALVKIGTLGIVGLPAWRLTSPQPAHMVPVNLERAFGGQCRIDLDSKAADSVPKRYRLAPEQAASHPDVPHAPVAHDAFEANPTGQGFMRDWYLGATGVNKVPAPQIETPKHPITLEHFNCARVGKLDGSDPLVAGLGVRPKGHPERAKLVGTIDRAFIESDAPLPQDFDFAVWNAAWPDQQVDGLRGDEHIELVNLCDANTAASRQDSNGNTALTLTLPGNLPFVLVRFDNGAIGELESKLDTVMIDPDQQTVSCVWRATLPKQPGVRALEARMIERADVDMTVQQPVTAQPERVAHG
ncbi:multidrug-efflux transporter protein [Ralstonia solanacearum]|nr:multidrug-efflux transporter protein [Ralstonia solanacearum]